MAQAPQVKFCHFILTRFNLPISVRRKEDTTDVLGEDYLKYRFDLFESACMPSVINQSCQNFKWLILFDSHTPEYFKQRAEGWNKSYNNLIPCYLDVEKYGGLSSDEHPVFDVDNDSTMLRITQAFVADIVSSLCDSSQKWLLTTRLDNDDALHRDYVKTLQDVFMKNPEEVAYDFVNSYKYIPKERIIYRYSLVNGHFISLSEQISNKPRSVLFCSHLEIDKYVMVRHFYRLPLQAELIHGGNVVNGYTELSVLGLIYAFLHFRKKNFGYKSVQYSRVKALIMIGSLIKKKLR